MIPHQLQKEEFRFIKVKAKAKQPMEKDWNITANYSYDSAEILKHLKEGGNYGVMCGAGGLLVLDFDDEKIQNELLPKLPQTFTVKSGSGLLHKYYTCDEAEIKTIRIKNGNEKNLIDIQGHGTQVIGPNSIHPNGNAYQIFDDSPISKITKEQLNIVIQPYIEEGQSLPKIKSTGDNIVQQIKQKIKISDLMSELGFDTSRRLTECIWHGSKNKANFHWDDEKGVFNCFHCDKGGDVINLYMEHYHTDFNTAKKDLAKRAGIKLTDTTLKINDYMDNVEKFFSIQPFFYDKAKIFWKWDVERFCWERIDETDIMNSIEEQLNISGATITAQIKNNYLEAFRRVGRKNIPKNPPKTWVQFRNKIFDISTKEIITAIPEYFICNPIPWDIGETDETPQMDKLIHDWVGEKYVDTLYEILAYCCYADYPIHLIFTLTGCGCNGKSCYQRMLMKFIGASNSCATDLDDIAQTGNRFEKARLFKKLVCQMGETNFNLIEKTSLLKKLTGQDMIPFEIKNKDLFEGYNYAKIIINSNSLPSTTDDTDGFYRRWLIIDFPNTFPEGCDITETIPDEEYKNLSKKIITILPDLLKRGYFTNQGSIEERRQNFIINSNPLSEFLRLCCDRVPDGQVRYGELYAGFSLYLKKNKKRSVSHTEFNTILNQMGLEKMRSTKNNINALYILELELKFDWKEKIGVPIIETMKNYTKIDVTKIILKYLQNFDIISKTQIINNCITQFKDLTELDIEEIINSLKKEGEIFEPKIGFIKKV